jgi:hypothetical protein
MAPGSMRKNCFGLAGFVCRRKKKISEERLRESIPKVEWFPLRQLQKQNEKGHTEFL